MSRVRIAKAETRQQRLDRARRARRIVRTARREELQAARDLNRAINRLEPVTAQAFRLAVARVRSGVNLEDVAAAVEAGDLSLAAQLVDAQRLELAMRGQGLRPGERSMFDELEAALRGGGDAGARQLGPERARLVASLDLTNPKAIEYLRQTAPTSLRGVSQSGIQAVRASVLRGFEEGRPAREVARDLRDSIGLTPSTEEAVANFRRQLETGELGGRTPPDQRRLSGVEQQQARSLFRAEKPSKRKINALVKAYRERLLNRRSMDIARTEIVDAHNAGQAALWDQAVEQGLLIPEETRRDWIVTADSRLRDSHASVPGMNLEGVALDEPFRIPVPPGFAMRPHASGNPSFDINCRCTVALRFLNGG